VFGFLLIKSFRLIKNIKLIWLWLIIPLAIAFIISIKIPVLNYFRFLFLLPAFYLIVASAITSLGKRWQEAFLGLLIAINLITSAMYLFNQKFQREDWRNAVYYIENNKITNSRIIFPANSQMEAFHYYAPNIKIYGPEGINNNLGEIWLIRYAVAISDPNDITRLRIEDLGYHKTNEYDFNGVVIWKYNMSNENSH